MAKKINETDALMDMATAKEAINAVKGWSLKDVQNGMAKAAAVPSLQKSERTIMAMAYAMGRALLKAGKPFSKNEFDVEFNAFASKHWTPTDMPSDASMKQYRSRYGAFCEAGMIPWSEPVVLKVMARRNLDLSKRAPILRSLTQEKGKPLAKAPADKLIHDALFPPEAGPTDHATAIKGIVTTGVNLASNPNVIAAMAQSPELARWLRPVLNACLDQRANAATSAGGNAKLKAEQLAEVTAARAALAKIKGDDEAPSKRNRRDLN